MKEIVTILGKDMNNNHIPIDYSRLADQSIERIRFVCMIFTNEIIEHLLLLDNLSDLFLVECETLDDISDNFALLDINNLLLDEVHYFNFHMLDGRVFNELEIRNMTINSDIMVNCNVLKVINCNINRFEIFTNSNINKLIIKEELYLNNKSLFDSLNCVIEVMDNFEDNVLYLVNNNG